MLELVVFVFFGPGSGGGGGGGGGGCDGGGGGDGRRKMRAVMRERFGVYEATQLYYVALGCFVVVGELVGHLYKIDCYVYIILCVVCIVDEIKIRNGTSK